MRKTGVRRGIACLGAAAATAVLASPSCSAPSKGALIMSITTDMQTPKDISVIAVYVETNSVPKLDYIGRVLPDGTVSMPSTLAIVEPDDPSAQVRIRVIAFQEQKARVLRDVLTTVPHQRTALLRLPLDFLDDGSVSGTLPSQYLPQSRTNMNGVPEGDTQFQPTNPDPTAPGFMKDSCDWTQQQTMIDGACQAATVDSNKLPDYSDSAVFGDGGSSAAPVCFDVASCFAQSTVVSSVTANGPGCWFSLPQGVNAADVNVALATPGTGTLVNGMFLVPLESDPGRGFSVQGQTVSLVPGVCSKLKTTGTQLVVSTSNTCASKVEAAPVCEPNQKMGGGAVDAGLPSCSGSYTVTCPSAGTCTGPGCGPGQCAGGYVDVTINGTSATITGAASVDGGGLTSSVTGTVNPATCTVNVDAPVGCDGGAEPWTLDLSNGTVNITYPGSSGASTCGGNLVMCSFTGCTATRSTPSPCDGTYVVTCPMTEGGCGGSPAEVVVSGSQATVYGASKDGGTLSGTVDTTTCVATIVADNNCTSGSDTATVDLKTGVATVPCGNGGACVPISCTVTPGTFGGDGGTVDDAGGGCSAGFTQCGNTCVDTANDPNNCGACGKVCVKGDICQNATCGAAPSDGGNDAGSGDSGPPPDSGPDTGPADAGTDAVVDACVPATCAQFGYNCGPAADGCGGLLQCGSCQQPEFCGGGGFNVCGGDLNDASDACVPMGCTQQGFNCGAAGDGCGNVIQCGTCNAPLTCGGGGTPGQCG